MVETEFSQSSIPRQPVLGNHHINMVNFHLQSVKFTVSERSEKMFVTFESEITAISCQTTDSCYQVEPQSATTSRRPPVTSYSGMRLPSRCVVLQFSVHYLCKVSLSQGQLCQECGLRWQQSRPRRPFRPLEGSFDGIKPPLRSEELPRQ